jgi:hypothetical protein
LIGALSERVKLPRLDKNIKNGNSLISGTDEELKKQLGNNFADKKPFNWQEEFPEVFAQGGFDCIIGNPPYVGARELDQRDKDYFGKNYQSAKDQYDLYSLFIEKGVKLMRINGNLGFIVPNKFLVTKYGIEIRKFLFDNSVLINFKDFSKDNVFPEASVYPVVLILKRIAFKNLEPKESYDFLEEFGFGQSDVVVKKLDEITNKMKLDVWRPIATSKDIIEGKNIVISNREINRYSFVEKLGDLKNYRDNDIAKDKIIMKKLCYNLEAFIDEQGIYPINTTYCIKIEDNKKTKLKYILAVLNSKLLSYCVRRKYAETALRGGYIELRVFQIEKLPILNIAREQQKKLILLVDKIIGLQKEIRKVVENSEEWVKIKSEIEKIDAKIDAEVYKIYGLTAEEIKIVEAG